MFCFVASPLGPPSTTLQQINVVINPNILCSPLTLQNSILYDNRPVSGSSTVASKFCASGINSTIQDSCQVSEKITLILC